MTPFEYKLLDVLEDIANNMAPEPVPNSENEEEAEAEENEGDQNT